MTNILAIDTASDLCSVSLLRTEEGKAVQCSSLSEHAPRSHVQRILPMLKELLSVENVEVSGLDAIAFGRGPGSFTGLRISSGITQGLAFGQDLPVVAISNLKALAFDCFRYQANAKHCVATIDARMNEVYWAVFERGEGDLPRLLTSERVDSPEVLDNVPELEALLGSDGCYVAGSGVVYAERLGRVMALPKFDVSIEHPSDAIARLGHMDFLAGDLLSAEQAAPIYIRDEVAWKKLPGRE